jgi:hypothetical protein
MCASSKWGGLRCDHVESPWVRIQAFPVTGFGSHNSYNDAVAAQEDD